MFASVVSKKAGEKISKYKFRRMQTPFFPNGFESWQKTHFEVVEVLLYIKNLEKDKRPRSFAEALDQSAGQKVYKLALDLTNKFEEQARERSNEGSLFDRIEEFVWNELKSSENIP